MLIPAILIGVPVGVLIYAYAGYPLLLKLASTVRKRPVATADSRQLPAISICLPAYNEASSIRSTIESLLELEYPADRRQILVISDASTDGTDEIAKEYASSGVELLRQPKRGGKTAAENAAASMVTGDIIVNTDATIRIPPQALEPLVRAFDDPTVGVASGRDISVGATGTEANRGESGYVGYEMWVRSLETQVGSIVGASGCFFAIRRDLHRVQVPEQLSRDFASALIARERGYRSVSVEDAVCFVPRTGSLSVEMRRKVRTMARGLDTLFYMKHLLNPFKYGAFALMLFSHKLCRWLVPLLFPVALLGVGVLALSWTPGAVMLALTLLVLATGLVVVRWPGNRELPRPIAACGYLVSANVAGLLAWAKVLRGDKNPIWEPTRRRQVTPVDDVVSEDDLPEPVEG